MATTKVYNLQGKEAGTVELADAVFGVKVTPTLIHQVYLALEANAREPWADTKNKGEVSGGGKKPWKQKGTGRARHGSIRSPLWKGGGVTFGPLTERNYKQKINRKMSQKAVTMCLSDKLSNAKMIVLENFDLSGKTKEASEMRNALAGAGKSTLILSEKQNENLNLATRNLPNVHVQRTQDVNVVDLLHHQYVIVSKDGVKALEDRFVK
ncbi:MAG: 50S ribosomal protein L4 [Candidatus Magasanikbacteria bacterium]